MGIIYSFKKYTKLALGLVATLVAGATSAQSNLDNSKFRQLGQELPTPNTYRSASGAPGHEYWQQRADYVIDVKLDDEKTTIEGNETITYYNNSPDVLYYLWLQLDQNIFEKNSMARTTNTDDAIPERVPANSPLLSDDYPDLGYKILYVQDASGKKLRYTINGTMMRVDLPSPIPSKGKYTFKVGWKNLINDASKYGGRGGYEFFPEDGNNLFEIAQWFPRMCVYDDVWGWQHKQYLGRGEFALEFGDYKVNITVPADHIVAATGELQNAQAVLTPTQFQRFNKAKSTTDKPVLIVTEDEAKQAEKSKSKTWKTWTYVAKNVRDFAFATSRKFIWDAMAVEYEGKRTLAMSYYPKEGNPLWGKYSTEVVAHTIRVYSKYSIAYPYPVAISVHGPIGGMEYPMICFNGGRPEKDGTYPERTKLFLIGVIIHEVGHNFFPMIVSSDERQWSWMDEGLNTFLQYLTEQEWERNFPSSRGEPYKIAAYMASDKNAQVPIMVNSESALQFGNNAYGKPATALNVLRETILGRELFDFAFKTYSQRWAFKHPSPADFFRTMEDASGTDLDWFWRGWFYTTDHVDISLEGVQYYQLSTMDPNKEKGIAKANRDKMQNTMSRKRDAEAIKSTVVDKKPELKDFYSTYDPLDVTDEDKAGYDKLVGSLTPEEKKKLESGRHIYLLSFKNLGGLVMPLIVQAEFTDGSDTLIRIPAEIWKLNNNDVKKSFAFNKPVSSFVLDPYKETADADMENNFFPRRPKESRFQIFKRTLEEEQRGGGRFGGQPAPNPMRDALKKKNNTNKP